VAPTTVSLVAAEITYGSDGTVTVTVSGPAGAPTPTGGVTLAVDGGTAQSHTLSAQGTATFAISQPSAGSHSLSASYASDGNFAAGSASGTLLVDPVATTTTISAASITYGGSGP